MVTIKNNSEKWALDNVGAVLFDKDGTIIDSHSYWGKIIERRAEAIIAEKDFPESRFDELCLVMGYSRQNKRLLEEGPIALVSRDKVIKILVDFLCSEGYEVSSDYLEDMFARVHTRFMENDLLDCLTLLSGANEFIKNLQEKGVKMAIVTSDTAQNAEKAMEHFNLHSCFSLYIGKESFTENKHTGIPAKKAAELLGVSPELVITLGDSPVDIYMAEKGGLSGGMGVATGQVNIDKLKEFSPYCCMELTDLEVI